MAGPCINLPNTHSGFTTRSLPSLKSFRVPCHLQDGAGFVDPHTQVHAGSQCLSPFLAPVLLQRHPMLVRGPRRAAPVWARGWLWPFASSGFFVQRKTSPPPTTCPSTTAWLFLLCASKMTIFCFFKFIVNQNKIACLFHALNYMLFWGQEMCILIFNFNF